MKKILAILIVFLFLIQTNQSMSNHLVVNDKQTNNIVTTMDNPGLTSKITTPLSTTFTSTWSTAYPNMIDTAPNQITLPLVSNGNYSFTVNWGDSNSNTITSYNQAEVTHTYASSGNYTVSITGLIQGWSFNSNTNAPKIIEISNWGPLLLGNSGNYFAGATHLVLSANDSLDLTGTTNLYNAFANCPKLGDSGNMSGWDVSHITDMSYMFRGDTNFNQNITTWDVSKVTTMQDMFYNAKSFNQPLTSWNVSIVNSMNSMFYDAMSLDQPFISSKL